MATTSTRRTLRRQLMDDLRDYGPIPGFGIGVYFTASAVAAGTVATVDNRFSNSDAPTNKFKDWTLYRCALTSADMYKRVNTHAVSSGTCTFTHFGANYSDTADTVVELWMPEVDPAEIDRLLAQALEYIPMDYYALHSFPMTDGDKSASATTGWTGSTGTTLSKVTTAGLVPYMGQRALRIVNDSTNDYAESSAIRFPTNKQALLVGFAETAVGTSILRLQGATSGSIASISTGESASMFMFEQVNNTSTDESVTLRLENDSASGDSYWGDTALCPIDLGAVPLPSWVNNHAKLKNVAEIIPTRTQAANVYDGSTIRLKGLTEGVHYRYINSPSMSQPHQLELLYYPSYPLVIHGSRPHSDIDTYTTDSTGGTTADVHMVMAVTKWLMGRKWPQLFGSLESKYAHVIDTLAKRRMTENPQKPAVRRMFA